MLGSLFCSLGKAFGGCLYDKPEIQPCGTIDLHTASSILLDKPEEMGCDADIYLPDMNIKIYNLKEVENSYELKEVSSFTFIRESRDCDDFAAKLYGKFASLAWTNIHALNHFIDETETFWWIEPQNKKISQTLETWQGSTIRFLLVR